MKKLYIAVIVLMILSLTLSVTLILLMPEQVPMHYGMDGSPDRLGSRWENLLFPICTVAMGIGVALSAKAQRKKGENSNEKIFLVTGIVTMLFWVALSLYMMISCVKHGTLLPAQDGATGIKPILGGMGILFAVLGFFMPKAKRNSTFGIRTPWSQSNDVVWYQSQRFGGIAGIVCGAVVLLSAIVLPQTPAIIVCVCACVVWFIVTLVASYVYYRKC